MSKKRPFLLIVVCAWVAILQACRPLQPVAFTAIPSSTFADISIPTAKTPLPPKLTSDPGSTLRSTTPTAVTAPPTVITNTPTTVFTLTATLTVTVTQPPTLTPAPIDPLGEVEAPDGKVLHAVLKRREEVTSEPLTATEYQPFETELLQLINVERAKNGAPPLKMSALLSIVAQSHSDEMAAHNYFGHNSLNGLTFVDRIKKAGYIFTAAAENLFAGSGPYNSPEYVISVWLNSSSHRTNMLDPRYTEVGIGYRFNPDSTYGGYFTADFGTP